jgi:DNA repair exonuclease SbcCD ATPase subunit
MKHLLLLTLCALALHAQSDGNPPSGSNLAVESGDALEPLRSRITQYWDQWQKVGKLVSDDLVAINDPCHPRVEGEITKLIDAMKEYFGARLTYTQTWSRYALATLEKQKSVTASADAKVKQLQEMEEQEQKDLDALQERMNKLPKDAKALTDDVRREADDLKKQIETAKEDLKATVNLEVSTAKEAASMQDVFANRAEAIAQQEKSLLVARELWIATYRSSLQSYASKCRLMPDNSMGIPRPKK